MKKVLLGILLIILIFGFNDIMAQCPMCKVNVESGMRTGSQIGRGLNTGILYLLAFPYLMVGGLGFWYWKSNKSA